MSHGEQIAERAEELLQDGEIQGALDILLESLRENKRNALLNLLAGTCYDHMSEEEKAIPYYEAAIEYGLKDQRLHDALVSLGSSLRITGDYEKSIEVLSDAVRRFPPSISARMFKAISLFYSGRCDLSILDMYEAIKTGKLSSDDQFYTPLSEYFEKIRPSG